ncbi:hypothetical protein CYMTET_15446 [Cymbomonas tetramitiformis]|uniref:Uncharacterized protein n=1 Tax=Cymbomonas tetramitiformis TaxID=36881 RepID=A0AAE0GEB2_9CHLO|nr:hypothetical protein CYMTET_15446 [Cymbomonas tetramitiformis]
MSETASSELSGGTLEEEEALLWQGLKALEESLETLKTVAAEVDEKRSAKSSWQNSGSHFCKGCGCHKEHNKFVGGPLPEVPPTERLLSEVTQNMDALMARFTKRDSGLENKLSQLRDGVEVAIGAYKRASDACCTQTTVIHCNNCKRRGRGFRGVRLAS